MSCALRRMFNREWLQAGEWLIPIDEIAMVRWDLPTRDDPHTVEIVTHSNHIFRLIQQDANWFRYEFELPKMSDPEESKWAFNVPHRSL